MKQEPALFGVCFLCQKHFPVEIDHSINSKPDEPAFIMPLHKNDEKRLCDGSGIEARWTFIVNVIPPG